MRRSRALLPRSCIAPEAKPNAMASVPTNGPNISPMIGTEVTKYPKIAPKTVPVLAIGNSPRIAVTMSKIFLPIFSTMEPTLIVVLAIVNSIDLASADMARAFNRFLSASSERSKDRRSRISSSFSAALKWSGEFGQRAKVYPTRMNGYENDKATELFRQV